MSRTGSDSNDADGDEGPILGGQRVSKGSRRSDSDSESED